MKKLITGAIVAAALAVPATPAFAIHHGSLEFVPECATSENVLGVQAFPVLVNTPAGAPDPGNSDVGVSHNKSQAGSNCNAVK